MVVRLLHIEEENLEIEITHELGLLIKDKKQNCEIEVSPQTTGLLLNFANVIICGFLDAQAKGLIPEELSPDWK